MLLSDIDVPEAWRRVADDWLATTPSAGPAIVLGAGDTGKSTLVRYLLSRAIGVAGGAVLLDGDPGMAMVGPPALVGLTLVRDVDALAERTFADHAWFLGTTTPALAMLPAVLGHARLAAVAVGLGLPTVVNTSGFVASSLAKELQVAVADAVHPAICFVLARAGEIDHIATPLARSGRALRCLLPSPHAREKSRADRALIRADRFGRYFATATSHVLDLARLSLEGTLLGSGRRVDEDVRQRFERATGARAIEIEQAGAGLAAVLAAEPAEYLGAPLASVLVAGETTGQLLGMCDSSGECCGVALLEEWTGSHQLRVYTPLTEAELAGTRRIRLGVLRLSPSGREELGPGGRERELGKAD